MTATATRIEKAGARLYFVDSPFAAKDRIKSLGAKWDGDRRQWWVGVAKREAAEKLVGMLNGTESVCEATEGSRAVAASVGLPADTPADVVADKMMEEGRDKEAANIRQGKAAQEDPDTIRLLDLPDCDPARRPEDRLAVTMLAAMAEFEARRIGQRVRDARPHRTAKAVAKEAKRLGKASRAARGKQAATAAEYVAEVLPLVQRLRERRTLASTAAELNRRGVLTYAGKPWTAANVDRLLKKGRAKQ